MSYEMFLERNQGFLHLWITEIPIDNDYQKIPCPVCGNPFSTRMGEEGTCKDVTAVCKLCHRAFSITGGVAAQTND